MSKYRLTPAREHVKELRMAKAQICKPVLVSRIQKTNCFRQKSDLISFEGNFQIDCAFLHFALHLLCKCEAVHKLLQQLAYRSRIKLPGKKQKMASR